LCLSTERDFEYEVMIFPVNHFSAWHRAPVELMLESISLVRVLLPFGNNYILAEVCNSVTTAAFVAKLRSCDLSHYLL